MKKSDKYLYYNNNNNNNNFISVTWVYTLSADTTAYKSKI